MLCDPIDDSMSGFPVFLYLPEFAQIHVHWAGGVTHSSHPLSSPSPTAFNLSQVQDLFQWICSSHRIFSNESALHIRWPKYWSFSFINSTSNEYSGLISIGWTGLIFLQSEGLSRVFSSTMVQKHKFFSAQPSLWSNSDICTWPLEKP